MFTSVASASISPPSRRQQNPTTGKSQPEQNSQDQNTSPQIYFFDSIGQRRHFRRAPTTSAMPPIATEMVRRNERRLGNIQTDCRDSLDG
jgi:hypothetical protein